MSAIAEPPSRQRTIKREGNLERPRYGHVLETLSALGAVTGCPGGIEELMRSAAVRACEALSIRRCGVYLREEGGDMFLGCAAHPREEIEPAVRRLRLGDDNDEITRQLVSTNKPVVIRDAVSDSRSSRAAIRAWKLRSLLAVPMLNAGSLVGLMIFDNADELHPYSASDVEIALAIAAAAAAAVVREQTSARLRGQLEIATRQNKLLRKTITAEHRLSETILGGGGLPAIVELVAELTGKPVALYDIHGQPVAKAHGGGRVTVTLLEDARCHEAVARALSDAVTGSCASVGPLLEAGISHRHLFAPVEISGDRWGWLVMMEQPTRLSTFDDFLLRRAATHLALELVGYRRLTASAADARAQLARQLIRGTAADDEVRRTAEYLGIDLQVPRVVVYLRARDGDQATRINAERVTEELRALLHAEVLATKGPEGAALLVNVPVSEPTPAAIRDMKGALDELLGSGTGDGDLIAGISSVCRDPSRLPGAYREAREVARCIETFSAHSSRRLLAADDLGPGRLFVANADRAAVGRFAEEVIGPLLGDDEGTADLLRTLESFYETGRSVRLSSERLGVHENTVRYRLSRVHAITGLDVASDADDQLSVQVALLVLRLQGHPALRPLDSDRPRSAKPAGLSG